MRPLAQPAPSKSLPKERLIQFRAQWFSDGRSERVVCQGRAAFVRRFIPQSEFIELFGGYVLSADPSGEEYLGVWSTRMCSRFRRILRERGAEFEVSRDRLPLRLKVVAG